MILRVSRAGESLVSTHSRPKAAGLRCTNPLCGWTGFNTQPPEGGWLSARICRWLCTRFQHTAARRRLAIQARRCHQNERRFNTQPPEGGWLRAGAAKPDSQVSTHSRPKAAGSRQKRRTGHSLVSTHSRPKAAGTARRNKQTGRPCFNTQPPEGGWEYLH